jgi:hypothetical protein
VIDRSLRALVVSPKPIVVTPKPLVVSLSNHEHGDRSDASCAPLLCGLVLRQAQDERFGNADADERFRDAADRFRGADADNRFKGAVERIGEASWH